jgi:hypothetical protein
MICYDKLLHDVYEFKANLNKLIKCNWCENYVINSFINGCMSGDKKPTKH